MSGNWYNGFSPSQRRAGMKALNEALEDGRIARPTRCSMCGVGAPVPIAFHNEHYDQPLTAYPVCGKCHYAIHIRFRRPLYWERYISVLNKHGWFQALAFPNRDSNDGHHRPELVGKETVS